MVTRTISLADDAYQALAAMRGPGESFSDVVRRLARRGSITELADIFDDDGAEAVAAAIGQNRRQRLARRKEELGLE